MSVCTISVDPEDAQSSQVGCAFPLPHADAGFRGDFARTARYDLGLVFALDLSTELFGGVDRQDGQLRPEAGRPGQQKSLILEEEVVRSEGVQPDD